MSSAVIKDLNSVVDVIKSNYLPFLSNMSFILAVKEGYNKYYIFQEIKALPIKRFVCCPSDNTFCIAASWHSREHWYSLIKDANDEEIEAWKDLLYNTRLYNKVIDRLGLTKKDWMIAQRYPNFVYEKKINKKTLKSEKFDTFMEMRIPSVRRINFYMWGFEFISKNMAFVAVLDQLDFPYEMYNSENKKIHNGVKITFEEVVTNSLPRYEELDNDIKKDKDSINIIKENNSKEISSWLNLSWGGHSFLLRDILKESDDFENKLMNSDIEDKSFFRDRYYNRVLSYWDVNQSSDEKDDFDEKIEAMIMHNEKKKNLKRNLNVGQREINILDLE